MNDNPTDSTTIDWPARLARAQAHTRRLKQEWAEAAKQRRPARYIAYDYRADTERVAGGEQQHEGEHDHAELKNRMDHAHV